MTLKLIMILFLVFISNFALSAQWEGKYLSLNGKNILVIDNEDLKNNILSFDIIGVERQERKASFFALINYDMAVTKTIVEDSACKLKLSKSNSGIFVSDFCEGNEVLTGFYEKSNDFLFESMQDF